MKEVLGIDLGGVIVDRRNDGTDPQIYDLRRVYSASRVPGAFEAIRQLVFQKFGDNVCIISRVGDKGEVWSRRWLEANDFCAQTGVHRSRIHFCRERSEKAGICERLGVTHFIDDRLEVLSHITSARRLYLFRPRPEETRAFAHFLHRVKEVQSWGEILRHELP